MAEAVISQRMWFTTYLISLSSFLFGYCLSALNSVMKNGDDGDNGKCYSGADSTCPKGSILRDIELDTWTASAAVAMFVFGAWLGCMSAFYPSEKYGRRLTLLVNNFLFLGGGILCAIANVTSLFLGRFMIGLGTGIESMVVPILLSEVAHPSNRGKITSIHQLMITIGILTTGVFGAILVDNVEHGWRYNEGFIIFPAILQLIYSSSVPESPRWLAKNRRNDEARKVLERVRGKTFTPAEIDDEMNTMITEESGNSQDEEVTWAEVLYNKKVIFIGVVLMFMGASTGINTVMFYSTTIFGLAGVSYDLIGTVAIGLINVFMTIISGSFVDTKGRKTLLLIGSWIMVSSLAVLATVLLSMNAFESVQGALAVLSLIVYVIGYAVGLGAVAWTVLSEIVPTRIRGKAYSLFVSVNWFCNLCISLLTLSAINGLGGVESGMDDDGEIQNRQKKGVALLYLLFCGICILNILFLKIYVPETKGKTLAELAPQLGIVSNEMEETLLGSSVQNKL